jgi:hypothetical protein
VRLADRDAEPVRLAPGPRRTRLPARHQFRPRRRRVRHDTEVRPESGAT